jgi:hypothetical protein
MLLNFTFTVPEAAAVSPLKATAGVSPSPF